MLASSIRSPKSRAATSNSSPPRSRARDHMSQATAMKQPIQNHILLTSRLDARHQPASIWDRKQDSPLESTLPDRRFSRQPQSHPPILLLSLRGRILRHPNMRHRHVIEGVTRLRTYTQNRGSIFAHPSSLATPYRYCFPSPGLSGVHRDRLPSSPTSVARFAHAYTHP